MVPEVELPLLLGLLDLALAGVVAGPGEPPVAELAVEGLQVRGGGARRLLRVAPLVHPEVLGEPHALAGGGDELPGAGGLGARVGEVREPALDHGEEDGVLGKAGLAQDGAVALLVAGQPAQPLHEVLSHHRRLEEADVGDHRLVHVDGDVVLGLQAAQVVADLREQRDRAGVLLRHGRGVAGERAVDALAERGFGAEPDGLAGRAVLGCGSGTSAAFSSASRTSSISADWASSSCSTSGASPASATTVRGGRRDGGRRCDRRRRERSRPPRTRRRGRGVARATAHERDQAAGPGRRTVGAHANRCPPSLPGQGRSGRRPGLPVSGPDDALAKARGLESGAVLRCVTGGAGGGRRIADDVARRVDGVEARGSMAGLALHAAPSLGGGHVAGAAGQLPSGDVAGDAVEVELAASLLQRLVGPCVRGPLPGGEGGLVAVPAVAGSAPRHLVHADEGGRGRGHVGTGAARAPSPRRGSCAPPRRSAG